MSTTKTIKVSYSLKPPSLSSEKSAEELPPKEKSYEVPIESSDVDKREYYAALRIALEKARSDIGDDLTKWRDIVGKEEVVKEVKKGKKAVVDEEQGEEEDEEDEAES